MSKEGKQIQFGRKLADSNKVVRERAIKVVTRWLSKQKGISVEDLKKLWKGLFFCMWHSDKLEVQHELANRLGELMFAFPDLEGILNYIRSFHWTILKEWHSIDKLRLDKFYSLIRSILKNSFQVLVKKAWDIKVAEKLAQILIDLPLNTSRKPEVVVSPGVAFHLADIYVEELEKSCKGAETPIPSEVINALLVPFFRILAHSENDILVKRTQEGVFGKLLREIEAMLTTPPEPDSMLLQVDLDSIAKTFFDMASSKDIVERHRKGLYAFKKKVETLDKKIDQMAAEAGSGDEEEEEESDEDEAQNIIEHETSNKDKKRKRNSADGNELGGKDEEDDDEDDEDDDADDLESQIKKEVMKEVLTLAAKYAGPKKEIKEEHVMKAMAELAAREAQANGGEDEDEDEEGAGEGGEGEEEDDDDSDGMDFSGSSDEDLSPEDKTMMKKVMKEAFKLAGKEEVNEQHLRRAMSIVEAREHALQDREGEEDSLDDEEADAALDKALEKEDDDDGEEDDSDDDDEEEESPVDSEEEELMQEIVKRAQQLAGPDGVVKEKHLKQAMDQIAAEDEAEVGKQEKGGKGKGKAGKKAAAMEEEDEEDSDEMGVFDEEDEAEMGEMSEEKMMQEVMELAAKFAGGKDKIQKKHVKQAIDTLSAELSSDEGGEEVDMDDMEGGDDEEVDEDDMDGDEDDEDMEDFSNFISSGDEDDEDGEGEDGDHAPEDAEGFQEDSEELEQDLDDDAIVQRAIELAGGDPSKVEEKHIDQATTQLAQERAEEEDNEDDDDDEEGIFEEADTDEDEEEEEEIAPPKGKKGAKAAPEQPKKAAAQPQKQQKQQQAQQQKPKAQPQKQQQAQQQKQQPKQQPQKQQPKQQQKKEVKKEPAVAVKIGNKKQKVESAAPKPEQKGKKQQRRVSLDDAIKAEIASGTADPVESLDLKFSVPAGGKKGNNKKTAAVTQKQPAQVPETKVLFKAPVAQPKAAPQKGKKSQKQQQQQPATPQKKGQSLKVASPENSKRPDTPHPGNAKDNDASKRVLGPVRFSLESAVKDTPKTEFSNTEIIGPVPVSSPDKRPEKGILKASPASTKTVTTKTTTTTTSLTASVSEGAKKKRKRNRKKKPSQQ